MVSDGEHPNRPPERNAGAGVLKLEFAKDIAFQAELRRRVDEFFERTGRRKRDCWQMYLKTAIILTWFGVAYGLLIFAAQTLWQGLLLAVALGLATAMIGFNIQHDGGHQAYSNRAWVNRLAALTLGFIGGSVYTWRWKHTVIHHMYVNIIGYDNDIDIEPLGRFAPRQRRRWWHRWQRFYLWPIYAFDAMKLQLLDDFRYIVTGRIGPHHVARPTRWDLAAFLVGKAVFACLAFAVPMLFHSVGAVLFYYAVTAMVAGMTMVLVFITPHLVEEADFPLPQPDAARLDRPWAVHQANVTVDFARHNRVLTWLLGGLNFHKEHHLFPLICHVNYPAMSPIVEETCREFGVPYKEHRSFLGGLASHYRWLRRMGENGE